VAGYLADKLGVEATHEALAEVPLDQLIAAQIALAGETQTDPDPARWGEVLHNLMVFEPVIDGEIIPRLPIEDLRTGSSSNVDLLAGSNGDEFCLFLVPSGAWNFIDDDMVAGAAKGYGLSPEALAVYRNNRPGQAPAAVMNAVGSDFFFRIPAIRAAESRFGAAGKTFVYEFTWDSPLFDGQLGACHAAEIPFVFDNLAAPASHMIVGSDAPQAVADAMHAAWVRFITTGDPGWSPYTAERRAVMTFDVDSSVVDDPRSDERLLWSDLR
jgi:para-nitrobenzyl esterase